MPTTLEQTPETLGIEVDARPPDQRREPRYAIPRGMKLRVRATGQDQLVDAELRDISRNGVGLLSPRVMVPGASISFPFGSQQIFADVRYCCPTRAGFVVGALILEVVAESGAIAPALNL
jgi:PilZ domain